MGLDDLQQNIEDILEAENIYIYTVFTCIAITVLYALLIYNFTGLIVWCSVLCTGIGIIALSFWMHNYQGSAYAARLKQYMGNDSISTKNYEKLI